MYLLSEGNSKLAKNKEIGHYSAVLHLAPNIESGYDVCPNSSPGCRHNCFWNTGNFQYKKQREKTINKTRMFFENRKVFLAQLHSDLFELEMIASRKNMAASVRLNGTSDIRWHKIDKRLFSDHPGIQFYDYTKNPDVALDFINGKLPENYHVTFSRNEINEKFIKKHIRGRMQVAVVVEKHLKASLLKIQENSIDGDMHDARFTESNESVILLKSKGKAQTDQTGFVIR